MKLPKLIFFVFILLVLSIFQTSGKILIKQGGTIVVSNATVEIVQSQYTLKSSLTKSEMLIIGLIIAGVFFSILVAGVIVDKTLSTGEFRRALAAMLMFGFTALLLISILTGFEEEAIVSAYVSAATLVAGFYFGSKATQVNTQTEEPKNTIESVEFSCEENKILVYYRNRKSKKVTVDGLYLNGRKLKGKFSVKPRSLKKIDFGKWEKGREYHIKVCTSAGECCEEVVKAPNV